MAKVKTRKVEPRAASQKPLINTIQPRPLMEVEVGKLSPRNFASLICDLYHQQYLLSSMFMETRHIERKLQQNPRKLMLAVISVKELGFTEQATLSQIITEGVKHRLGACPQETAFILRKDYRSQPADETLYFAMVPVMNCFSGMEICVLGASSDGNRYIGGSVAFRSGVSRETGKESLYSLDAQFVFVDSRR